jgi:hypothetical protein
MTRTDVTAGLAENQIIPDPAVLPMFERRATLRGRWR